MLSLALEAGASSAPYFFGYMGAAFALIFANLGAAYGTAKSGVGICSMGVLKPELVMRSIIPVVMAGVIGIYGVIVAVIVVSAIPAPPKFKKRILVSTDLFGRGIDIERVNIVVNYDFPEVKEGNAPTVASDQYLHRVGRAGRFGTKGLAISFISSKEDADILAQVQSRFEVDVSELPDQIDISSYMNS